MDFKGLETLAALPIAVVFSWFMYLLSSRMVNQVITFASNHMEHNTAAIEKLSETVTELRIWLKDNRSI